MGCAYVNREVPITVDLARYGTNPNSNYGQPPVWIVGHPLRSTAPNGCPLTAMGQGSKNFRDTPPYKGDKGLVPHQNTENRGPNTHNPTSAPVFGVFWVPYGACDSNPVSGLFSHSCCVPDTAFMVGSGTYIPPLKLPRIELDGRITQHLPVVMGRSGWHMVRIDQGC